MLFLISLIAPGCIQTDEIDQGEPASDIWSEDYANQIFPWASADNDQLQFRAYHDYFSMKARMQVLADRNPDFFQFHEGLLGGTNARGNEMTSADYEGWYYNHLSPWMKITGNVQDGDYNEFNGDDGNYADRPDIMLVGNHHAREWMSYEVPMFFLETIAYYYGMAGVDNDGDGLVDEDGWDGIDNDGDCSRLNETAQDSNGDGVACGPGDLGVDEDFSEQFITDMVNTREIYLIPLLNVDGNRYDREVFCGPEAYNGCDSNSPGWRKNLRDNTVTGITPIPDTDEEVNEGCDGVDLNRNYQFEWGLLIGVTPVPGVCTFGDPDFSQTYPGPIDTVDNDGDGRINEDHVDGKDDDADGEVDEDWMGGNSEPETKFIQDMTEMNDDNGDGASDFKTSLSWHSYSELVLWPWGHCNDGCVTPDDEYLTYHGDIMGQMTDYAAFQSGDFYPTQGDFCDWQYGVHQSYCYTIEIGNNFHEQPDDIAHISVRNLGIPFYMLEIADDPRYRAVVGIQNTTGTQWVDSPDEVMVPSRGEIPVGLCLEESFPFTSDINRTHLKWRLVEPTRQQDDFGPTEWVSVDWRLSPFELTNEPCVLLDGSNGTRISSNIPAPDTAVGKIHYKAVLGTTNGAFPFTYPDPDTSNYYELSITYRASFGSGILALMMFALIATMVWGGLGYTLRAMFDDERGVLGLPPDYESEEDV
tara:strand:- start:3830 stop:5926 length:2097 start_codon:yes stop_codon:yes gene_type:complete